MELEYRPFPNEAGRDTRQATIEIPLMVRALGLPTGGRVLEVGCGCGVALPGLARLLRPSRLVGLDIEPAFFAEAGQRLEVAGVVAELVPGDVRTDAVSTRLVRSRGGLRDLLPHRPAGGSAGGDRPGAHGWRPVHPRDAGEPAPESPGARVRAAIAVEGFRLLQAAAHRRPVERAAPARITRPNRQLCVVTAL
jgi:hypothetical protein